MGRTDFSGNFQNGYRHSVTTYHVITVRLTSPATSVTTDFYLIIRSNGAISIASIAPQLKQFNRIYGFVTYNIN